MPRLLLASASPRRAELLRAAGFEFDVQPAQVDESVRPGELPESYARRVAEAKAAAVLRVANGRVVVAADTVVVVDEVILGKPAGAQDAERMLRLLSGRRHAVLTAVTLVAPGPAARLRAPRSGEASLELARGRQGSRDALSEPRTRVETTMVEFAALSDEEIQWYVASGEPKDKAGAYAIQGLASRFVTRIEGSYSNVMGLPVALIHAMLREGGNGRPARRSVPGFRN